MTFLKYKTFSDDKVEYLFYTNLSFKEIDKIMKNLCKENKVSIFWKLNKNNLYIELTFCEAQLCTGVFKE